jgi:hypothetical protein
VRTERIVFAVAAAAAVAHLLNHLIVGVKMDLQFEAVLAFGAVTVIAAVVYPHSTDYTGLGATAAGGLLIGVGIAAALRGREARPPTHARRQAT